MARSSSKFGKGAGIPLNFGKHKGVNGMPQNVAKCVRVATGMPIPKGELATAIQTIFNMMVLVNEGDDINTLTLNYNLLQMGYNMNYKELELFLDWMEEKNLIPSKPKDIETSES